MGSSLCQLAFSYFTLVIVHLKVAVFPACQSDLAFSIFLDLSIAEVVDSLLSVLIKKQHLLSYNQSGSKERR